MNTKVCVVTFPVSLAGYIPLSNVINIMCEITNEVYLVSGGAGLEKIQRKENICIYKVSHRVSSNHFMRIVNFIDVQLKVLRYVVKISKKVDLFIFCIGGNGLFISILILKLLKKRVISMPAGTITKVYAIKKDLFSNILRMLINLTNGLADYLIIYSRSMIQDMNLGKYQHKVIVSHRHFVNFTKFKVYKKITERSKVVGYIGRLSEEKGASNLIESMPFVISKGADIRFVICGDGVLADKLKQTIKAKSLEEFVKFTGWISHEDVSRYLNEFRLLVLPSFTEGLPNILLEAMACSTPVLVTSVGAIPDVIREGETGFLLKSNDPYHIAERVVELLDRPDLLNKVSLNAYKYVREKFSYENTLETWRVLLNSLGKTKRALY